jgi:hypothetical protein
LARPASRAFLSRLEFVFDTGIPNSSKVDKKYEALARSSPKFPQKRPFNSPFGLF